LVVLKLLLSLHHNNKQIGIMKTYNEILETIKNEINTKVITSVSNCRNRIETLCNENNQSHNMFLIALIFGVA